MASKYGRDTATAGLKRDPESDAILVNLSESAVRDQEVTDDDGKTRGIARDATGAILVKVTGLPDLVASADELDARVAAGTGSPEGVVAADPGAFYQDPTGVGTWWYKASGTGNTGWSPRLPLGTVRADDYGLGRAGVDPGAAINAAIAASAALGKGDVLISAGSWTCQTQIAVGANQIVTLRGFGKGATSIGSMSTRLVRGSSLAGSPLVSLRGTGPGGASQRCFASMSDLHLDGNGTAGALLEWYRPSSSRMSRVRLSNTVGTDTLLHGTEVRNSFLQGCYFSGGGSLAAPQVLYDSADTVCATVGHHQCIWESADYTALKIDGGVLVCGVDSSFEGGGGDPTTAVVHLNNAQKCHWAVGKFITPSAGHPVALTGPLVRQTDSLGTASSDRRPNSISQFDWQASGTADCMLDVQGGWLYLGEGNTFRGSPTVAPIQIASGAPYEALLISPLVSIQTTSPDAIKDNRSSTNAARSFGTLRGPIRLIQGVLCAVSTAAGVNVMETRVTDTGDITSAITGDGRHLWYVGGASDWSLRNDPAGGVALFSKQVYATDGMGATPLTITGLTSAQIDALHTKTPANGYQRVAFDGTNTLVIVRYGGKWYKSAALTQIA